jgi:hypothetical protein
VQADPALLEELFRCYFSPDEVVRLRTSNAFKRLWREHPAWIVPYIDRFIYEASVIDQPSAQWTFAQLALELDEHLTAEQRAAAKTALRRNLDRSDDWIVVNSSLQVLGRWAKDDADLRAWLTPVLERYAGDARKSVAGTAAKVIKVLAKQG